MATNPSLSYMSLKIYYIENTMATPDKRYHCSDVVPGDINTRQQLLTTAETKEAILESYLWLLTLLHFDGTI